MYFKMSFSTTDIDECKVKDNNNCTSKQKCVNKPGSYDCPCIEGYHMDEPERVVSPIDQLANHHSQFTSQLVSLFIVCLYNVFAPSDSPHRSRSCAIIS